MFNLLLVPIFSSLLGLLAWLLKASPQMVLDFWQQESILKGEFDNLFFYLATSWILVSSVLFISARSYKKTFWKKIGCILPLSLAILAIILTSPFVRFSRIFKLLGFNISLTIFLVNFLPPVGWSKFGKKALWLVLGVFALFYSLFSLNLYQKFSYPARDLAIFDQALWHLAHFETPAGTVRGVDNLWGDHFHPILVLVAPFYKFFGGVQAALVLQALILVFGGWPIYQIAKAALKRQGCSLLLATSYLLFIGFQYAVNFGFYPETFIPTFFAFALYFLLRSDFKKYSGAVFLALLCKENAAIYFLFLGFYVWIFQKRPKTGIGTAVLSLVWFWGTVFWIIPQLGDGTYHYFSFLDLKEVVVPWTILSRLISNEIKVETVLIILVSVGFLPLLGVKELFLAIPMIFERFFFNFLPRWTLFFHYSTALAPVLFLSIILGLARLVNISYLPQMSRIPREKLISAISTFCFISALGTTAFFKTPFEKAFSTAFWRSTPEVTTARALVSKIPPEVSVSATNALAPHLSQRKAIYHFPETRGKTVDYIVISQDFDAWPLSEREVEKEIEALSSDPSYVLESQKGGTFILRRQP